MLNALYRYAIRENLVLPAGYVKKAIRAYVSLGADGRFLGVIPGDADKVPCPDIGSMANSGEKCNVLAEKRSILFPGDEKQRDQYAAKRAYFQAALSEEAREEPRLTVCLKAMGDETVFAAVSTELDRMKVDKTKVLTFLVDGESVLEMPKVLNWWEKFRQQFQPGGEKSRCLITGNLAVPMSTVPPISGLSVVGGHARGDALICFDKDAFCSYGLKQAANAPVSEDAYAGVKAALDALLSEAPVLAGMKFVHWYDKPLPAQEDQMMLLLGAGIADEEDESDGIEPPAANEAQIRLAADELVRSVESGKPAHELPNLYYILLLSGVNGRVMVRAYQQGNYRELTQALQQWERDLALTNSMGTGLMKPAKLRARLIRLMSKQNMDRNIFDRMSKELSGLIPAIINAILTGASLPDAVASRALAYLRSQMLGAQEEETRKTPDPWAVQWLKAWLCRRERKREQKEESAVEYNPNHSEPAYHCGALVAVYGAIQSLAMPEVNAGLIDRYYASASQTPALVIGQLSRLSNYHVSKLEGLRTYFVDLRDEVASAIGDTVPTVLTPEQQAYFALGYYQMGAKLNRDYLDRKAAAAAKAAQKNTASSKEEQ